MYCTRCGSKLEPFEIKDGSCPFCFPNRPPLSVDKPKE